MEPIQLNNELHVLDDFPAVSYTYCIARRNLRGGMHLRVR